MIMDDRKPLNVNACNLEEMRAVARDAEANFVAVFEEVKKLRVDFDALIARLEQLGAHPT